MDDIKGLLEPVTHIVKEAGKLLLSYRNSALPLSKKYKSDTSFVTEADVASESFLIEKITELTPEYDFYTEEYGHMKKETTPYCWVIDPLDGTNNFAQGLPHFCISVGLTYHGEPVLGVVYQPVLDEFFYALKGRGAYLNGARIKVSLKKEIQDSFLVTCIPYVKSERTIRRIHQVTDLALHTCVLRVFGAAALDQAYVACGRVDGIFFGELSWWDVAAGMLLIQEAGGVVTQVDNGAPVSKGFQSYIGGNALIHQELLQSFLVKESAGN